MASVSSHELSFRINAVTELSSHTRRWYCSLLSSTRARISEPSKTKTNARLRRTATDSSRA